MTRTPLPLLAALIGWARGGGGKVGIRQGRRGGLTRSTTALGKPGADRSRAFFDDLDAKVVEVDITITRQPERDGERTVGRRLAKEDNPRESRDLGARTELELVAADRVADDDAPRAVR